MKGWRTIVRSGARNISNSVWVVLATAACSQPTHGPADAPPHADAHVDAHIDARADASVDAGACGGVESPCNTVANIGSVVTPTCVAGTPPTMTGGTILNGTYVLVSAQAYTSNCTALTLPTGGPTTLVITDGCMQSIDAQGGAQNYAVSEAGNELMLQRTCPGPLMYNETYSATSTMLSELAPLSATVMIVSVFQKQ